LKILLAGRTSNAPRYGFPNHLPAVKAELVGIQKTFSNQKLFLDENFIWNKVTKSLKNSNFSVLHIATHGKFSSNRQETFILDFENKPLNMDNLDSLFQDEDPIELLTFSACETAEGDNRAVLGLAGLAVKSQALSTLAGLWQLDDNFSAKLMIQFYEQLKTSGTKAKALTVAQQTLLQESSEFKHPSFWSPYIIVGNWL
ncbi:MAG TPA: CHAT domain-containing protein, partial [Phormidium sp.]